MRVEAVASSPIGSTRTTSPLGVILLLKLTSSYSSPDDYHSVHMNVCSDKCMKTFARYAYCKLVNVGQKRLERSVITDSDGKLRVLSSVPL